MLILSNEEAIKLRNIDKAEILVKNVNCSYFTKHVNTTMSFIYYIITIKLHFIILIIIELLVHLINCI